MGRWGWWLSIRSEGVLNIRVLGTTHATPVRGQR